MRFGHPSRRLTATSKRPLTALAFVPLLLLFLQPFRVAYPWRSLSKEKNDYFQYGTPECLAVGGLGHFAIWLDSELLHVGAGCAGWCDRRRPKWAG